MTVDIGDLCSWAYQNDPTFEAWNLKKSFFDTDSIKVDKKSFVVVLERVTTEHDINTNFVRVLTSGGLAIIPVAHLRRTRLKKK